MKRLVKHLLSPKTCNKVRVPRPLTEEPNIPQKNLEQSLNPRGAIEEETQASGAMKDWPEEFGFKIKGPEPTRYGDWEIKGKCSDF